MDYGTKLFLGNDLRFLEMRLRAIVDALNLNTSSRTFLLYSINYNIDQETRNKILQSIGVMLNEIQDLKQEFDLEEEAASLKEKLMSTWKRSGPICQIPDLRKCAVWIRCQSLTRIP